MRAASVPATVWAMSATFALYAATHDLWLSMALYLSLISLNVAMHSAARALGEALQPEAPEGRAAGRRGGRRRRGSFLRGEN